MLRKNRHRQNQQQQKENNGITGEKRRSAINGGDPVTEPKAKRVASNGIRNIFSRGSINISKTQQDGKPRNEAEKSLNSISVPKKDEEAAAKLEGKPIKNDPCAEYDYDNEMGKEVDVSEYAPDVFKYYKHRQEQFPIMDYLKKQEHLTIDMRAIVVDWLINMQQQLPLLHETLYLAVKIMDLHLTKTHSQIHRSDLQLISGSALLLASKFEEHEATLVADIVYMLYNKFTSDQITKMEQVIFKTLGFDLGIPLSYRFLRRFARVINLGTRTLTLARYILEVSLMFYQFVGVKDDLMASAALLLSLRMEHLQDWDFRLVKYSGYTVTEVEPLMKALNHMIVKYLTYDNRFDTVYIKYNDIIYYEVAKIPTLEDDEYALSDPIGPPKELSFK